MFNVITAAPLAIDMKVKLPNALRVLHISSHQSILQNDIQYQTTSKIFRNDNVHYQGLFSKSVRGAETGNFGLILENFAPV